MLHFWRLVPLQSIRLMSFYKYTKKFMCKGMRLTMMKRLIGIILVLVLVLAGCGGSKMDVVVEEIPKYKNGIPYPIVLSVMDGDEAVTGLEIIDRKSTRLNSSH